MVAEVATQPGFRAGPVRHLFEHAGLFREGREGAFRQIYDVSLDGERFAVIERVEDETDSPSASIHVVQNWYEEFRDRVQD